MMKHRQSTWLSLVAVFLLLAVALGLTGCGAKPKQEEETANAEPVHLVWWVYASSDETIPKAMDEVLQKVNEMSAEKIGVTVEMKFKNEEQFTQAMSDGEYFDMAFTCDWCNDFDENARAGKYYNITSLLKSETPDLYSAVDPWWKIGMLGEWDLRRSHAQGPGRRGVLPTEQRLL